jgi:hypothetical protein
MRRHKPQTRPSVRISHEAANNNNNSNEKMWEIRLIWDLPELSLAMTIQLHKASQLSLGTGANVNQTQERVLRFRFRMTC